MKSHNEIIVTFTEFAKRAYDEHMPDKPTGTIPSMGDYIKQLKKQLELIEAEIASEKNRLLNEASLNPTINIEVLSQEFFRVVDEQHVKWMNDRTPK